MEKVSNAEVLKLLADFLEDDGDVTWGSRWMGDVLSMRRGDKSVDLSRLLNRVTPRVHEQLFYFDFTRTTTEELQRLGTLIGRVVDKIPLEIWKPYVKRLLTVHSNVFFDTYGKENCVKQVQCCFPCRSCRDCLRDSSWMLGFDEMRKVFVLCASTFFSDMEDSTEVAFDLHESKAHVIYEAVLENLDARASRAKETADAMRRKLTEGDSQVSVLKSETNK